MYLLEVLVTNGRDVNLNEIIDDVATTDRRERKEEVTSRVWEKKEKKRKETRENQPVRGRRKKGRAATKRVRCNIQKYFISLISRKERSPIAIRDNSKLIRQLILTGKVKDPLFCKIRNQNTEVTCVRTYTRIFLYTCTYAWHVFRRSLESSIKN